MNIGDIKTVGVAGAGTMGQGIAQVCALAGFDVLLYDVQSDAGKRGITSIGTALQKSVEKNRITLDVKNLTLSRIKQCDALDQFKGDLIIEAVVERLDIKRELFQVIRKHNPESILTTNTSSIPITQIASGISSADRIAGLHFFNPAPVMKLVEVIKGVETSNETIDLLKGFSEKLGKTSVVAKDSPGFIVNRVARHYYVEALKMLEENSADVQRKWVSSGVQLYWQQGKSAEFFCNNRYCCL